ncbi:MAG TPA: response regulator transcription factor [Opitutaceae bacterium]|jgi:DNA-binding NarL/FixJ family response regulator
MPEVQKKCKIVIVDDHPVYVTLLGDLLGQRLGFAVVGSAQNGQDGLEICRKARPDLVMVDMLMPEMSGLELIKHLRRERPDVLLLAVSGMVTRELIHMAFVAGANAYFSKSRSIEELLGKLDAMSKGRSEMTPEEADALRWALRERRLRAEISTKDLQLLRLFSDEVPVKKIAVRTGRTPSAVYKAFKRIMQRLDAKTNRELRVAARGLGLLGSKEAPK